MLGRGDVGHLRLIILLFKGFGSHRCFDNSFHRLLSGFLQPYFLLFVLPGILSLPYVFSLLSPRMSLSNSKIFFQSSLSVFVFDVILSISFPVVQYVINLF